MTMPAEEPPVINFAGEKVAFGPLRRDLMPLYQRWVNDFEVTRTLNIGVRPKTYESHDAWYEAVSRSDEVHFTVYDKASLQPIGTTELYRISHLQQRCEFGIMIGDKAHWGRGCGIETAMLMLDYGFNALNLYTILLRVFSYNTRAIKAYERCGFKLIGNWRGGHRVGGKPCDVIFMDCIAPEFKSPVMHQLLLGD